MRKSWIIFKNDALPKKSCLKVFRSEKQRKCTTISQNDVIFSCERELSTVCTCSRFNASVSCVQENMNEKSPGSLHRVRNDKLDQRVSEELRERKTMKKHLAHKRTTKRIPKTWFSTNSLSSLLKLPRKTRKRTPREPQGNPPLSSHLHVPSPRFWWRRVFQVWWCGIYFLAAVQK